MRASGWQGSHCRDLAIYWTDGKIKRLLRLANDIQQVIWGKFVGYHTAPVNPWIIVIAFDSTWFEVQSTDDLALGLLRTAFKDVRSVT
jgi:hypothetical protein